MTKDEFRPELILFAPRPNAKYFGPALSFAKLDLPGFWPRDTLELGTERTHVAALQIRHKQAEARVLAFFENLIDMNSEHLPPPTLPPEIALISIYCTITQL